MGETLMMVEYLIDFYVYRNTIATMNIFSRKTNIDNCKVSPS